MPGIGMMFTSSKTTYSIQKKIKTTKTVIKPAQIGNNFMGLSTLKKSKGCKSCGHQIKIEIELNFDNLN